MIFSIINTATQKVVNAVEAANIGQVTVPAGHEAGPAGGKAAK